MYKTNDDFKHFCGMMDGLAFLPPANVLEGMEYLRDNCPDEGQELLSYFDLTHVNGTYRNVNIRNGNQVIRRTPPLFPIEMWNVNRATLNSDPRTNNMSEGANNRYRELVEYRHPPIWRSIEALQLEEKAVRIALAQHEAGVLPPHRIPLEIVRHQQRLKNLCEQFDRGEKNLVQFLKGIGQNI